MRRKNRAPVRQPHPDPRIELELQRILSARAVIARAEERIALSHMEIESARDQQDYASSHLRTNSYRGDPELRVYEAQMRAQRERIAGTAGSISDAEQLIAAMYDQIAELTAKLADVDLTYLDAL